jgi:hypothetical protein
MAVSGEPYCTSAWNGLMLHLKHNSKYVFAINLAYMFIFLGKIFIACLNCTTYYLIVKYITKDIDAITSIWGPITMIAISTIITAHIFLCLFDEAVIATLHCLAIDLDLNEGKPKFGPPTFHQKIAKVYGEDFKTHEASANQYQQLHNNHNDQLFTAGGSTQPGAKNQMA